jgi:hypothetical protein
MSLTVSVLGQISLTDNLAGSVQMLKALTPSFVGTSGEFAQSVLIGTSPVAINVPLGLAGFVYVKNVATGGGSTPTVTVSWYPNGGISAIIGTLPPGGLVIFSASSTDAITSLTLTASAANTPVEYILVA